jgi:hypothetical protein
MRGFKLAQDWRERVVEAGEQAFCASHHSNPYSKCTPVGRLKRKLWQRGHDRAGLRYYGFSARRKF